MLELQEMVANMAAKKRQKTRLRILMQPPFNDDETGFYLTPFGKISI